MNLIDGNCSLVILNDAFNPAVASSMDIWKSFGKIENHVSAPPAIFRVDYKGNYFVHVVGEGKIQITLNQPEIADEYDNVKQMASTLVNIFGAVPTKSIGVNLAGNWAGEDLNINEWRERIFKFDFKVDPLENKSLSRTEFRLAVDYERFVRNIKITEMTSRKTNALNIDINNHFNINDEIIPEDVISESDELLRDTLKYIQDTWMNL